MYRPAGRRYRQPVSVLFKSGKAVGKFLDPLARRLFAVQVPAFPGKHLGFVVFDMTDLFNHADSEQVAAFDKSDSDEIALAVRCSWLTGPSFSSA